MPIYSQFDGDMIGYRDYRNLNICIKNVEWGYDDNGGWGLYVTIEHTHDDGKVTEHRLKVRNGRNSEHVRYRYDSEGIDWRLNAHDFVEV